MIGQPNFFTPVIYATTGAAQNLSALQTFFPPLLSFEARTGIFTGYLTTGLSPYDGLTVFQTGVSGQKLMVVQSGMWKTVQFS
jgi:hypothetical protein